MKHRDSSREQILDRAVQLTSSCGLHGLSIGQLAKVVGMSKGGICAHFRSKEELQLAVIERAAQTFAAAVVLPAQNCPEGLERLRSVGEHWFRYLKEGVFEGGCFFTNVLYELDDLDPSPLLEKAREQYQRYLSYLNQQARVAQNQGQLSAELDLQQFVLQFHAFQLAAISFRALGQLDSGLQATRLGLAQLLERS
jgi:AcrR family transcriptional regulator